MGRLKRPVKQVIPTSAQVAAIAEVAQRDVFLIVDYDNIAIPLRAAGAEFPAEGLLEFARRKGDVLFALVFIPMNVPRAARLFLRRNGYRVVECPPLKDGGGDTVDKTIEEFMRILMLIPSVGTFILVSRDADFQDANRMAQDHGKVCVSVYYNRLTGDVRSEDGELIRLSVKPQVMLNSDNGTHNNGLDSNKFCDVIRGIEIGTIAYDPKDLMHRFVVATVEVLLRRERELENPSTQKNFMSLRDSVWVDLRPKFKDFSQEDMRNMLTALNNGVILRANKDGKFTYYTFDNQCPFVRKLQVLCVIS